MKIRKAKKQDLKEIAILFKKEFAKPPYHEKWTDTNALKKIGGYYKKAGIIVACLNEEIKGFIVFGNFLWDNEKRGEINEIVVYSKEQGKGIGRELMGYAENFFKKKGIKRAVLMSHNKSKAYKIHKKAGYKEDNLVQMIKKL